MAAGDYFIEDFADMPPNIRTPLISLHIARLLADIYIYT